VSTNALDGAACRAVWEDYVAWSARPGAELSLVNLEVDSTARVRAVSGDATAVEPAVRGCWFHTFLCTMYADEGLADEAGAFGRRFRRAMLGGGEERGVV
jgi:hypothetical protein